MERLGAARQAYLAVGLKAIGSHLMAVEVCPALGLMAAATLLGLCRRAPSIALLSRLAVACLLCHRGVSLTNHQCSRQNLRIPEFPGRFCHLSCIHPLLLHAQQPPAKLQLVKRCRLPAFPAQVTKWKGFCLEFCQVAEPSAKGSEVLP